MRASHPGLAWFTDARFGLFLHWGLYSLQAVDEWIMQQERQTPAEYEKYLHFFDPDLYDPRQWAATARAAGMRYAVLTAKHHDGFCLWDSKLTEFKSTNAPIGRDLVAEFVQAFRDEGLRVGLYYSLLDWKHPDFTIDGIHPQRDEPNRAALNEGRDMARYTQYLHGQVAELLTGYGPIDYLFFDFSYSDYDAERFKDGKGPDDWRSTELLEMIHRLQPNTLVNDRLGIPADITTPENHQPLAPVVRGGKRVAWESCHTLTGKWSYSRPFNTPKPAAQVVQMLIDGVSNDGNLLLNVGPTARGEFDPGATSVLESVGSWLRVHGRSIYGAGHTELKPPADARYTQRGNRLYLHLFAWPGGPVVLPGLAGRVAYAQLLQDASEIKLLDPTQALHGALAIDDHTDDAVTLTLPEERPNVAVPVIELFLNEPLD